MIGDSGVVDTYIAADKELLSGEEKDFSDAKETWGHYCNNMKMRGDQQLIERERGKRRE